MPTYQYRCTECGTEIERVQKFTDPALTVCEDCGGTLRKVYNAVGVVFKGSGFYSTDNRTKGASSTTSTSSSSDTSSTSTSSASSSESKPSTTNSSTTPSSTAKAD